MELTCVDGLSGIYCITNVLNGKKYVGQAKDINSRWHSHIASLQNGTHYNSHFQRAWDKYGEDSFTFSILEICNISDLSNREIHYITLLETFKCGYNMTMGGEGTRGYRHTDEYKAHMSEIYKGRNFSPETRLKMSLAKKGKAPAQTENFISGRKIAVEKLKGRKFSDEHKKHLSEAKKGCIPWNKGKHLSSEYSPTYGKHLSEETKKKIGDANRGRPASQAVIDAASKKVRCVETGRVYPSITAAAKEYGVTIYALSNVLRGKSKTCRKLHWEYVN